MCQAEHLLSGVLPLAQQQAPRAAEATQGHTLGSGVATYKTSCWLSSCNEESRTQSSRLPLTDKSSPIADLLLSWASRSNSYGCNCMRSHALHFLLQTGVLKV